MILFTANFTTLLTIFGGLILLLSFCCLFTSIYKRMTRSKRRGRKRSLFTPQSEMIHLEWQLQQQLSTMSQAPMPLPLAFTVPENDQKGITFDADLEMVAPTPLKSVHVVNGFYPNSTIEEERKIPTPASSVHSMISHRPASRISDQEINEPERPVSRARSLLATAQKDSPRSSLQEENVAHTIPSQVEPVTRAPASVTLSRPLASDSPFLPLRGSPNILNYSPSPFSPSPSLPASTTMMERPLSYCHSSASESNLCSNGGLTHAPLPCRLSPILSLDGNWNNNRAPWEAQIEVEHSSPEVHLGQSEQSQSTASHISNDLFPMMQHTPTTVSSLSTLQSTHSSMSTSSQEAIANPSDILVIKPFEVIII